MSELQATSTLDLNTHPGEISCKRDPHRQSQSQVYTAQDLFWPPEAACIYLSTEFSYVELQIYSSKSYNTNSYLLHYQKPACKGNISTHLTKLDLFTGSVIHLLCCNFPFERDFIGQQWILIVADICYHNQSREKQEFFCLLISVWTI